MKRRGSRGAHDLTAGATLRTAALQIDAAFRFYELAPHTVEGHMVCRIAVRPADGPVYVDKRLYVRTGNQTKELHGPDLVAYQASRWQVT